MSLDIDDETLRDFISEVGEILELLSKQLVQLEKTPTDIDLLNTIFRGFHTIKGGAGFLSFSSLVDICHASESIFDLLRQRKLTVNAGLMDLMLKVVDVINTMFTTIKAGGNPTPAAEDLLKNLALLTKEQHVNIASKIADVSAEVITTAAKKENEDITEEEFELLLDKLNTAKITPETNTNIVNEDNALANVVNSTNVPAADSSIAVTNDNDLITEAEFEILLDNLEQKQCSQNNHVSSHETVVAVEPTKVEEQLPEAVQTCTKIRELLEETTTLAAENHNSAVKENISNIDEVKKVYNKALEHINETSVRVDTARLDQIMNMVGELVLVRNRLVKLKNSSNNENIINTIGTLDLVTADLQIAVMKTRMQPIKKVFGKFSRVIRDLARSLQKEIVLEISGEDTDLDKNLIEVLADILIHLVRNAVDHGIEMPEVRLKANKARIGKILFSAAQAGDHIILSVEDDGEGMDPEELRRQAVTHGILKADIAAKLTINECFELIFIPGFSTKAKVSELSGRGVGMDVVKTKIEQLNGRVEIISTKGKGTKINITVPLTLAILPTLMVVVGEQPFAIPLSSVSEIFDLSLVDTHLVEHQLVVVVRNRTMPLFYLRDWLVNVTAVPACDLLQHVVVVTVGIQQIGLVVDKLLGQEEVVIKAFGNMLRGTVGIAGATITGDGNIAMILDIPSLLKRNGHAYKM